MAVKSHFLCIAADVAVLGAFFTQQVITVTVNNSTGDKTDSGRIKATHVNTLHPLVQGECRYQHAAAERYVTGNEFLRHMLNVPNKSTQHQSRAGDQSQK